MASADNVMASDESLLSCIYGTIRDFQDGSLTGTKCIFAAIIKEIGPTTEYQIDGSMRKMRNISLYDETSYLLMRLHNPRVIEGFFRKGKTYAFTDILPGETRYIAILGSRGKVHLIRNKQLPEGTEENVPNLDDLCKFAIKRPVVGIAEAVASPKRAKITTEGKVLKVNPTVKRYIKGELVSICNIKIADNTRQTAKVGLFRNMSKVGESLAPGTNIRITDLCVGTLKGKPVLSSTDSTSLSTLTESAILSGVSPSEVEDSDSDEKEMQEFTITGISAITVYRTCIKDACGKRSLDKFLEKEGEYKCRTCGTKFKDGDKIAAGIVLKVVVEQSQLDVTIFTEDCLKLLRIKKVMDWRQDLKEYLEDCLTEILPTRVRGKVTADDKLSISALF